MTAEIMNPEKVKILDLKEPIKFRNIDKSKINKTLNTIEEELSLIEEQINNSYLEKDSQLLGMCLYNAIKLTESLSKSDLFHYAGLRPNDIICKGRNNTYRYNVSNYAGNIPKSILEEILEKDKFLNEFISKSDLGSFIKIEIKNTPYIKLAEGIYQEDNIKKYIPSLLIAAPAKDFTNPKSYVDVLDPIVFKLITINCEFVYIKLAQWL